MIAEIGLVVAVVALVVAVLQLSLDIYLLWQEFKQSKKAKKQ